MPSRRRHKGRSLSSAEIESLIPTLKERGLLESSRVKSKIIAKKDEAAVILKKASRQKRVSQPPSDRSEPFPERWLDVCLIGSPLSHLPISELLQQKDWLDRRIPFLHQDSQRLLSYKKKRWAVIQEIERRKETAKKKRRREEKL
jgi:hypothetical protein